MRGSTSSQLIPPPEAELRARIDEVLEQPRPYPLWPPAWPEPEPRPVIPGADPDTGWTLAWIRPKDLVVTKHSDFPYHYTPDELAQLCVETAQDREQAHRLGAGTGQYSGQWVGNGLMVKQVRRPGGSAFWVSLNGNHRALSFHALGLPLVPARFVPAGNWWQISLRSRHRRPFITLLWPRVEAWWFDWQVHPTLLELLRADGLIREYRQDDPPWGSVEFYSEHAVPWFLHPNPSRVPSLLKAYEAKFGTLEDARYDWLRTTLSIRRRLWAHDWPEVSDRLRGDVRRFLPAAAGAAVELLVGVGLILVIWLLFNWWTGR
jgi:hypothetical protein